MMTNCECCDSNVQMLRLNKQTSMKMPPQIGWERKAFEEVTF